MKTPTRESVDEITPEQSCLNDLDEFAEKNGLVEFTNKNVNAEYLELPTFLTDCESRELGKYFHTLTMQKSWAISLRARVKALMDDTDSRLDECKARIFSGLPQKLSVTEKELKLYEDEKSKQLLGEMRKYKAQKMMLDSHVECLESSIFDVSREITRREGEFGDNTRGDNIDRKRR